MTRQMIDKIEQKMSAHLDETQKSILHNTLVQCMIEETSIGSKNDTQGYLKIFLAAKRVEGCSEKTIRYYDSTIRNVLSAIDKDAKLVTTDDLRVYLDEYQKRSNASKVTIDNIRRILSSFFAWLEDENYITKSPVRRIHKVKTCKTVKETYSDEALELMRDHCDGIRDLAMLDDNFIQQIKQNSLGSTNRQRIKEEVFLEYQIVLPPLSVQQTFEKLVEQSDKSKLFGVTHRSNYFTGG